MRKITSILVGDSFQNVELLHTFGFNDQDYTLIVSNLPDSKVTRVTRMRDGEFCIVLQNQTSQMVVQLLGNPNNFTVGRSQISKITK